MHQTFVYCLVGLVSSWLLPVSTALCAPAIETRRYGNSDCTIPAGLSTFNLLDVCTATVSSQDEFVRSELFTLMGSDKFIRQSFTSPDCTGPVAETPVPTVDLGSCTTTVDGMGSEDSIATDLLPGNYVGIALWRISDFPGTNGSTCFPEITTSLDPADGARVVVTYIKTGTCLALEPGIEFQSVRASSSDAEFADATLYATSDCGGASMPLVDCHQMGNIVVYAGDLAAPKSSGATSKTFSSIGLAFAVLFSFMH